MTEEAQALVLNAIPLLALSALYLAATLALAPAVWRDRAGLRDPELALTIVCAGLAAAGAVLGGLVLVTREPLGASAWPGLVASLLAIVPAVVVLAGRRRRAAASGRQAREAQGPDLERDPVGGFAGALVRAEAVEEVARLLVERSVALLGVEFGSLTLVEGSRGRGVLALHDGERVGWWRELELDLEEPSAIASAAFEAAPFAVFDIGSSPTVNQTVATAVGAKSGLWVPLVSGERVLGVLALATTTAPRAFSSDEVALVQGLASEASLALDRVVSGSLLADALARERLVAGIARKVRSELDLDALLEVAVEETAAATAAGRCFVRLGEPGGPMPVAAEWAAGGRRPGGALADHLLASELAARERRTVAIADVAAATELTGATAGGLEALEELGSRAVLATPITVADHVVGVLALHDTAPRAWGEDVPLAEAVAQEVGLAVHVARVLGGSERRLGHQTALLEAARVLTGELDFDLVIERLVEQVVDVLGADAADCWIYEDGGRMLRCRAVHGLPDGEVGREIAPEGTIGEAIALGRPLLKREFAATEHPPPSAAYRAFEEVLVAPIGSAGRIRGALGVCSRDAHRFDDEDLDVLGAFAGLAAVALHNAEAFEERDRQARFQRGFYRIAEVLGEPLSLAATLEAVAEAAREALGGSFAAVLMPDAGRLETVAELGLPEPLRAALAGGLSREESLLRAAAEGGRVVASLDVPADERFDEKWRRAAREAGYRSLLAVPVERSQEQGHGLVLVFFEAVRRCTDDDLELAEHLARAAGASLERSARYEEERTARSLAQELARTGSLLATELDPEAVLEEVVRLAPKLVGVDACAIRVLDDDELVLTAVEGEDAGSLFGTRSPGTAWLSGDVVQSRAPLAVADAASDERLLAVDPLLRLGHRAYLGVPLTGPEGSPYGVLAVYSRTPRTWRSEEVEALLALAGNASVALSNAELYQRVALEKERSFAILANIADGIVAVDRDGDVVLWNSAAEQITGVPAAEALGRSPLQVLGRNLESGAGGPGGDRLLSILRGSEEVWLSLTEAVMRDPAGAVAGRIYAFRDISGDRLVEQMKSDFVSTVSQELRRPLTSIYGFAETLLRRDILFGEEERRTFLGYIASESERLTAIVDALLNVARLDTGDLQVNLAPTDIGSVVSEVVSAVEAARIDGHRFVVELPAEPVSAEADAEKLRLVLTHLVDNAVKFSPSGGTVTVAARSRPDTVEVSVADEGIGIAQSEQQRIFRKFYRGDASGARQGGGGTGLGLFIAEGLVSAMGGRIWVSSAEGEGASFTFELPRSQEREPAAANESRVSRV